MNAKRYNVYLFPQGNNRVYNTFCLDIPMRNHNIKR